MTRSLSDWADLRIDAARFRRDFESLAQIGQTPQGGVHRPALSAAHLAARGWFSEQAQADGLAFQIDAAGNQFASLQSSATTDQRLLLGSHLDSVPNGGRFDGALGVVAALEVLRTLKDSGLALPVQVEAVDFMDEEGTWLSLTGSRAVAGLLSEADLAAVRGGADAFDQALSSAGLRPAGLLEATIQPDQLVGFLEIHVEQADRLSSAGSEIGIVSSIAGINAFDIQLIGRADHSGTTLMGARRDAGLGAAALIVAATEMTRSDYPDCVINFGQLSFIPGAFNIVPARADLAMEFRAPNAARLAELGIDLKDLITATAAAYQLESTVRTQSCSEPGLCSPEVQDSFSIAAERLGLQSMPLYSGAGHDTQSMASICPAGMIFVPSSGGSHNPDEFATPEACENGANVLLQAALNLIFAL
jgi:N-carbamoyl-L-amino-acid hydrolase